MRASSLNLTQKNPGRLTRMWGRMPWLWQYLSRYLWTSWWGRKLLSWGSKGKSGNIITSLGRLVLSEYQKTLTASTERKLHCSSAFLSCSCQCRRLQRERAHRKGPETTVTLGFSRVRTEALRMTLQHKLCKAALVKRGAGPCSEPIDGVQTGEPTWGLCTCCCAPAARYQAFQHVRRNTRCRLRFQRARTPPEERSGLNGTGCAWPRRVRLLRHRPPPPAATSGLCWWLHLNWARRHKRSRWGLVITVSKHECACCMNTVRADLLHLISCCKSMFQCYVLTSNTAHRRITRW